MGVGESRVRKVLSGGWAGWSLGGFIEGVELREYSALQQGREVLCSSQ